MIYLKNISSPQQVFIPRDRETEGLLKFSLKNTINLSVPVAADVVDLNSDLYVIFEIELPEQIATGEYEYELTDDAGVISSGLLVVEGLSSASEYNISVQYEQYE